MAITIKGAPPHGTKVMGPPEGWRPRALSVKEKLEIVVRQEGKEPGGARLKPLDSVHFDHDPALKRRVWDPAAEDTIPSANDLDYIVALNKPTHVDKTNRRDIPEIAKTKRLEKPRQKKSRKWPTRPFPKK